MQVGRRAYLDRAFKREAALAQEITDFNDKRLEMEVGCKNKS